MTKTIMNYLKRMKKNKKKEESKMKKIKIGRLLELLLGVICMGFLLYEFAYFLVVPFINGGHLPSLTYLGIGINLIVIAYLTNLEMRIR